MLRRRYFLLDLIFCLHLVSRLIIGKYLIAGLFFFFSYYSSTQEVALLHTSAVPGFIVASWT